MPQPKILRDLPPAPPMPPRMNNEVLSPAPGAESLKETIRKAILQKNPDLANMQEPGEMGAEGAIGMPPDNPPMEGDQMLPGGPGASGMAPLPPAGPSPMTQIARAMPIPQGGSMGVEATLPEMSGAPPAAEARFQGGTGAMDRQIANNLVNNRMLAKKAGVTPEQLQGVMPGAYRGERPGASPGSRQAMIEALLHGMGFQ